MLMDKLKNKNQIDASNISDEKIDDIIAKTQK
jgi:hypothetical protein